MRKPLLLVSLVLCAAVGVGTIVWIVSRDPRSVKRIEVTTPPPTHDKDHEPSKLAAIEKPLEPTPAPVERHVVEVPEAKPLASAGTQTNPVPSPTPELVVDTEVASSPPKDGVAGSLVPVTGGESACAAAYKNLGPDARKERLQLVEAALAEYSHGDPKEPEENARYQDFKAEAAWLRAHPTP